MPRVFITLGITLALGAVIGLLAGGSLRRLSDLRFSATFVLLPALTAGLLPLFVEIGDGVARGLVTVANLIVLGFILVNVRHHRGVVRAGLALLLAGWLLNAIVITLNGAMPLSSWAYAESGQTDPITEGEGGFFKIEAADASTRLRFLGDAIPLRPIRQVLSAGDVVLMVGIGVVIAGGMRPDAAVAPKEPRAPTPQAGA